MTQNRQEASESEEIEYEDFSIKIEPKQGDAYPVLVLSSPAGEGRSSFVLPFEPSALGDMLVGLGRAVRGSALLVTDVGAVMSPQQVGGELFEALFSGPVRSLFDRSQGMMEGPPRRGLRIKIHLDPDDPSLAALLNLPWELLYRQESREFFSVYKYSPVIRYLNVQRPSAPLPLEPPLRILVAMASPIGCRPLDLTRERQLIEERLIPKNSNDNIEVDFIEHATVEKLQERLRQRLYHVLHFMGHGAFDDITGQGVLLLEDEAGQVAAVDGAALGDLLRDVPTLGLVFLNACDTARVASGKGADPFAGVAAALVLAGVRAVVAMQLQISDQAAITFAKTFYRLLANGSPVDYATAEGRMAIRQVPGIQAEWSTPVLFMRVPHGAVFDVIAPQPARAETKETPQTFSPQTEAITRPAGTGNADEAPAKSPRQRAKPGVTARPLPQKTAPVAATEGRAAEQRQPSSRPSDTARKSVLKRTISRLSLNLSVQPSSVKEGGVVTWTVTVANTGEDDLREVNVKIGAFSLDTLALPMGEGRQMTGSATMEGSANPTILHFVATGLNSLGQEVHAEAQWAVEVLPRPKAQPAPPCTAKVSSAFTRGSRGALAQIRALRFRHRT